MKITEKDGTLTMRDFPTTDWAYGALLISGFFVLAGGFVVSLRKPPFQAADLIVLAVLAFILYFAYLKLSSPIITTRVALAERIIEITHLKFGLIKKTQTFKFPQIKHFEMIQRKRDRAFIYCNSMLLADGTYIDLESEGYPTNTVSLISTRLNELLKTGRKSRQ